MKLLLTSAGITNNSIAQALSELAGKPLNELSILFIPTAANPVIEDKNWLINNLTQIQEQQFKQIDILDISGLTKTEWLPHFEAANILCFGGGNEQYLAKVMRDSGVAESLPEFLKNKIYVGISAGSMVMGQFLPHDLMKVVYPEESFEVLAPQLAFVDCLFLPHLNSEYFTQVRKDVLDSLKSQFSYPLYACDDNTALKIVDGNIEIVSEGDCYTFKP